MPRPSIDMMIDLSDRESKRKLLTAIGAMQGLYEVEIEPRRDTATTRQRGYLFGVVYEAVRLGISEAWGEELSKDEVHVLCRDMFLERPLVNRNTGEVVRVIPGSTRVLSTVEMAAYIEQIIRWAGEYLNVEVPAAGLDQARPAPVVSSFEKGDIY